MHAKPNAGKATWLLVPSFKHDSIEFFRRKRAPASGNSSGHWLPECSRRAVNWIPLKTPPTCRVSSAVEQRFCNSVSAILTCVVACYLMNVFGPKQRSQLCLCAVSSYLVPRYWVAIWVAERESPPGVV